MVVAFIGTVLRTTPKGVIVQDVQTKEELDCELNASDALDLTVGATAVFTGQYSSGHITVRRFNFRKFLEPMYEDDLTGKAGEFALLEVIGDPFVEVYKRFMEEERLRVEEEANAASLPTQET